MIQSSKPYISPQTHGIVPASRLNNGGNKVTRNSLNLKNSSQILSNSKIGSGSQLTGSASSSSRKDNESSSSGKELIKLSGLSSTTSKGHYITNSTTLKERTFPSKIPSLSELKLSKGILKGGRIIPSRISKIKGGLPNVGLTCYLNSVLQCIFNLDSVMSFFENGQLQNGAEDQTKDFAMSQVFTELFLQRKTTPSPFELLDCVYNFKLKIGQLSPDFKGIRQNDAHEFLRLLLDELHNEIRQPDTAPYSEFTYNNQATIEENYEAWQKQVANKDNSLIYDLFGGVLHNAIQCPNSAFTSENFEYFLDLSLPLKKDRVSFSNLDVVDINACFREFFKDEVIEGFTCGSCNRKGTHIRKIRIYKTPNILVLHLKRFEFLKRTGRKEKISSKVQTRVNNFSIPKEYCYNSSPAYNLTGIVNHYGTTTGGHYTAIAYDSSKETFLEFDDDFVSTMSHTTMKRMLETYGCGYPYLYFYCKSG